MKTNETSYDRHDAELPDEIEQLIDRAVDTQGLSYADARERVLGTGRARRALGYDAVRRTVNEPVSHSSQPELDIFGDNLNL